MEARCHEVLDAAYEAGVRYVDVARSYGLAEAFLATWLEKRDLPPNAVEVASKWGYTYVGEWRMDAAVHEVKDHSVDTLRRQLRESRDLLDGWLDRYQIHSVTADGGTLTDRALIAELARLREDGLEVGITVSGPRQGDAIGQAFDVDVDGVSLFSSVQATWNLLERSAGSALAEAYTLGWTVLVKEGVANGRLTPHADPAALGSLPSIVQRRGVSVDAVALAAALAQPWTSVVLSGAATVEQLDSNLAAHGLDLSPDDLAQLDPLAEPADRYWSERSRLPWT